MPIYEYQCKACCHCFEELMMSASDPAPVCPECDCKDVEKLMSGPGDTQWFGRVCRPIL